MRYRYAGTDPQPDEEGGIARPGEFREFDTEPSWGPWELVPDDDDGPQAAESPAAAPGVQAPAPRAASAAPASTAPAGTPSGGTGGDGKDG